MRTSINIAGKLIEFKREIFNSYKFHDLTIVIFKGDYPQQDKNYNNAIALNNNDGSIEWEIESFPKWDYKNPYEGVHDSIAFLTFFKMNSIKVNVNRKSGKIITNLDFNTNERPW